ncbi:YopX family protein [Lactiplantibacillus plantarum]|uniref:YopX family protein n=1 Tax=Lactiplantibacillus plantarum TaxID=1590 RepID=UPI0009B5B8A7|nr:YopX family protein [Lactiplantibacillus plantarum]
MIKFRAWYMPFGKYGAIQEMVYSRASHILALAEMEPEKYIPEQFTGLKDANGNDIYVGDILWAKNARWIVTNDYQMKLIGKNIKFSQMILPPFVEIIGNVHENPELLEEDK